MIKGIPVSPGIAIGEVFFLESDQYVVKKYKVEGIYVDKEIENFELAVLRTKQEILELKEQTIKKLGEQHSYIFDAHFLLLKDDMIIKKTIERIAGEKCNADYILMDILDKISDVFSNMKDEYLKERSSDIYDVIKRIVKNLLGIEKENLSHLTKKVIIISNELTPSDTVLMDKEKVLGFATNMGGKTSHVAIMARSMGIPAVVGLKNIVEMVSPGDTIILDGNTGEIFVNPDKPLIEIYTKKEKKIEENKNILEKKRKELAQTLDGYKISIMSNIEFSSEVNTALDFGAEGVGLFRTEYLYLKNKIFPTEKEQFEVYKKVASEMYPYEVIIRTLDIGGDKFMSNIGLPEEMNPFMGCRAIRLCLERLDIFEVQLRAILRASSFGKVKLLIPMISGIEEIRKTKKIICEIKDKLRKENFSFDENIKIGIMIEIPSASLIADIFAREVDFFSIGTNDLIQYTLAVDRINEKVAYLYNPFHPAILRSINYTIKSAHEKNIPVSMCGEMAGDPLYTTILLGLELDELSMSPLAIPQIKEIIRKSSLKKSKKLVKEILLLSSAEEIEEFIKEKLENFILV
ncbi:MAG: phosphoenolpyruvate--protein phosphotransferase [bacterium]